MDDLEESPNKAVELENSGGKPKKPVQQTSGSGSPDGESQEDIRREEQGLLGRRKPQHRDKKCLVIDLDETLVHSSFKAVALHNFSLSFFFPSLKRAINMKNFRTLTRIPATKEDDFEKHLEIR